ncbi:MAG TPA: DUF952 domain-containing protein [Vicinamibacterales bacterium]|nr:DUF952 domain-containing protein [Vicinamibacterales bacterium]
MHRSADTIYKILPAQLWTQAVAAGVFNGSPVDIADGFIHFSTAGQVRETAAKHFAGQADLVLVAIAIEQIGQPLKWELSRGGALFPHLYTPLPVSAALWAVPLPVDEDGRHVFPELS